VKKLLPYRPHVPLFGADAVGFAGGWLCEPDPDVRPVRRPHKDSAAADRRDHGADLRPLLPDAFVGSAAMRGPAASRDTAAAAATACHKSCLDSPGHERQAGDIAWNDIARLVAELLGAAAFVDGAAESLRPSSVGAFLSIVNGRSWDRRNRRGGRWRECASFRCFL